MRSIFVQYYRFYGNTILTLSLVNVIFTNHKYNIQVTSYPVQEQLWTWKKICAIKDWPTLTSVTNIRSFLGLVGYYQKFIENFLRITCPMMALQKKANKFLWTDKCEESFQNLKQLLMTAPVLWIADPNGDFVVCMDASKERLGGVLLQNDHVFCYESIMSPQSGH